MLEKGEIIKYTDVDNHSDSEWFPPSPPPYDVTDKLREINLLQNLDPTSSDHFQTSIRWRNDIVDIKYIEPNDKSKLRQLSIESEIFDVTNNNLAVRTNQDFLKNFSCETNDQIIVIEDFGTDLDSDSESLTRLEPGIRPFANPGRHDRQAPEYPLRIPQFTRSSGSLVSPVQEESLREEDDQPPVPVRQDSELTVTSTSEDKQDLIEAKAERLNRPGERESDTSSLISEISEDEAESLLDNKTTAFQENGGDWSRDEVDPSRNKDGQPTRYNHFGSRPISRSRTIDDVDKICGTTVSVTQQRKPLSNLSLTPIRTRHSSMENACESGPRPLTKKKSLSLDLRAAQDDFQVDYESGLKDDEGTVSYSSAYDSTSSISSIGSSIPSMVATPDGFHDGRSFLERLVGENSLHTEESKEEESKRFRAETESKDSAIDNRFDSHQPSPTDSSENFSENCMKHSLEDSGFDSQNNSLQGQCNIFMELQQILEIDREQETNDNTDTGSDLCEMDAIERSKLARSRAQKLREEMESELYVKPKCATIKPKIMENRLTDNPQNSCGGTTSQQGQVRKRESRLGVRQASRFSLQSAHQDISFEKSVKPEDGNPLSLRGKSAKSLNNLEPLGPPLGSSGNSGFLNNVLEVRLTDNSSRDKRTPDDFDKTEMSRIYRVAEEPSMELKRTRIGSARLDRSKTRAAEAVPDSKTWQLESRGENKTDGRKSDRQEPRGQRGKPEARRLEDRAATDKLRRLKRAEDKLKQESCPEEKPVDIQVKPINNDKKLGVKELKKIMKECTESFGESSKTSSDASSSTSNALRIWKARKLEEGRLERRYKTLISNYRLQQANKSKLY